jgi:hypothetical protein
MLVGVTEHIAALSLSKHQINRSADEDGRQFGMEIL